MTMVCFRSPLQLDEYDMMVRELGFEMKAAPSEKLKTPEELACEERERLQRLEVRTHCVTARAAFPGPGVVWRGMSVV